MSPLQKIPARLRLRLYWTGYVVGVLTQGIAVTWVAITAAIPEATMPVGLVIAIGILGLAQTQLNLLAGTNVVTEPVVPAREVVVRLADAVRTVAGPASPLADGTQVRVTPDLD